MEADRTPVLIGIGEYNDRCVDLDQALDPVALMAIALEAADGDCGDGFLARADTLFVVNQISWRYADIVDLLCHRLRIDPATRIYGAVGGETPVAFLQDAAQRIADGRSAIVAICGGEAHASVAKAAASGHVLNWPTQATASVVSGRSQDFAHPLRKKMGIHIPVTVYPLFENAQTERWGQTPSEGILESAELWSRMSEVASRNPMAAIRTVMTPDQISTPAAVNRLIAWPYTKRMVANIAVNQSAALIVTSLASARAAGIDDGRLIFILGGNFANEPAELLDRDDLGSVAARDATLRAAMEASSDGYDAVELYSCFPCVPKAARRAIGLPHDTVPTVAGGLTFFGAPMNNYMSHATAAMVRTLRERRGTGLLYGQGGIATKHRTLRLSTKPPSAPARFADDLQNLVDARRRPAPHLLNGTATATVETHTVLYDRDNLTTGVVIARTADGRRCLGRIAADDAEAIALLQSLTHSPIGRSGEVSIAADGTPVWRFTA